MDGSGRSCFVTCRYEPVHVDQDRIVAVRGGYYVARQLASIIPTILLSVVLNFMLLHAAPGDPARVMAGRDNPTEEQIAAISKSLGLDRPLPVQFWNYLTELARGNMGQFWRSGNLCLI
ncbi:MAG: hypothetical protein R2839_12370 [Thermomicrobiales bacterium]